MKKDWKNNYSVKEMPNEDTSKYFEAEKPLNLEQLIRLNARPKKKKIIEKKESATEKL